MTHWIRGAITLVLLLVSYVLMVDAFHRMNLPSNTSFFRGGAEIFGLLLTVPLLLFLIWRRER